MTIPRSKLIDPTRPTWVHCTSRCVRRAFLCANGKEHRRQWIEDRLAFLARCFAVEVAGYAVMGNHLHVIVRMDMALPYTLTDLEVARRWLSVYPRQYLADGTPQLPSEAEIASIAKDGQRVAVWRKRLWDLGWFMKSLKEPLARRANREDNCKGTFWEGRFHSVPLLDQPALIAAMAYVDLNPIRAKMAKIPEESLFTSARRRIRARNRHRAATKIKDREPVRAAKLLAKAGLHANAAHPEDGLWLCPLARCMVGEELANRRLTVDEYLTLVDATGRLIRKGKRGAIPPELAPILSRLDLTVDAWLATMLGWRMFGYSSALGHATTRAAEAGKRGLKWIKSRCPLFAAAEQVAVA
jgi:REP element-mobilizing transposase RayT